MQNSTLYSIHPKSIPSSNHAISSICVKSNTHVKSNSYVKSKDNIPIHSVKARFDLRSNTCYGKPSETWLTEICGSSLPLTVEPILGGNSFLIRNLLSSQECKHLIQETESLGYKTIDGEYNSNYRSNTRLIVVEKKLTQILTNRIEEYVPTTMFGNWWSFCGLNETLRFCKYTSGQHFSPHSDSKFVRNVNEQSFLTCMIYLNDVLLENGGSTRFLDRQINGTQQPTVLKSIQPEQGMAIVFPHSLYHDGQMLLSGSKYILRSDVMYRKEPDSDQSDDE